MYGIIYKVTNKVNLKVYIGQTIGTIKNRMKSHKCSSKKTNSYFHNAIRKYGWDSFVWEEIYSSFTIEDLNEKEIYFIELFNSHCTKNGYNIMKGGGFINPLSIPEVKERWYKKLCETMKNFTGDNNVMKRTEVKEKHQQAIIELSKNPEWIEAKRIGDEKQKSTYEITFPDGHIEIVIGLNQFCKNHQLQRSKMSSVSTGNRKHHKGFKCKLLNIGCKIASDPYKNKRISQ